MGIATFFSRILGLVREQVFAILFGAGNLTDAFNVAFRLPNLLRDLFAEGAMSASLVPTFTKARAEDGDARAWRVAGLVFRVLFITVIVLSLLGILFAPQLVNLYAQAFHKIPGKFELTVRLTRTMFPFFPLVALAAAFMGILNACGIFFLPAFSSALFNLGSIVVGVLCVKAIGWFGPALGWAHVEPIEGMAIGVLAGGAIQAFCQCPALYRAGYKWRKRVPAEPPWYRDHYLKKMLWMMLPGTVGLAATQINIMVNTILATSQGAGPVSWLNYAFRLMQFPIGLFGISLASAMLPRVSRQWVNREEEGAAQTLTSTLKQVFAINLPASAGLAFIGGPIIQLIFQYGKFKSSDTQATAMALAMYAIGLTAYSSVKVLVPACYALGNTKLPVISSGLAVMITICLNLILVKSCGYWGLALGTSIAAIINAVFLLFAVRGLIAARSQESSCTACTACTEGKKGYFVLRPLVVSFLANLAVAIIMGGICAISSRVLDLIIPDFSKGLLPIVRCLKVLFLVLEGLVVVIALGKIFRLQESGEIFDIFIKKIKNKLSPAQR